MDRWATFDCYGTLIDWETGIRRELARLWPEEPPAQLLSDFHAVEALVQRDGSLTYREVLRRALRAVAEVRGLPLADGESGALAESLPDWTAFPEVPGTLEQLREQGWKLAILSNTDPDLLDRSLAQLGVDVDLCVVASEIGSYKPDRGHWDEFRRSTRVAPGEHVHVAASLFHDIAPCADLSIPAVWVNRHGEESDLPRAAEITDLSSLPRILETV